MSIRTVRLCLTGLPLFYLGIPFVTPLAVAQSPRLAQSMCPSQLGSAIDTIIRQPSVQSGHWGILVQPQNQPSVNLYSRNADQLFMPASNAKLLTTAAAMVRLTPRFQRQTLFLATGQAPSLSTLRVVGQGDPTLNDSKLQQVVLALKAKGVQSIGTLIGDDSTFQGPLLSPTWTWEDIQGGDGLPINSLMLNGNIIPLRLSPQKLGQPLQMQWVSQTPSATLVVQNRSKTVGAGAREFTEVNREGNQLEIVGQLRVGSHPETVDVPAPNPGLDFLDRFRALLATQNIQVGQLSLITEPMSSLPQEWAVSAINFPSLSDLMTQANRESNNLYAEVLLKVLGTTLPKTLGKSTADQGFSAMQSTLTQLGVDSSGYRLLDGSGLSRQNLSSPKALVQTLQGLAQSPSRNIFRSTLAVAGQSGTLKNRFLGTLVQGRLYGKTGTLQGAATLSGYLERPTYPPLVLSILVNHSAQSNTVLRQVIDQVVLAISQLKPCSETSQNPAPQVSRINSNPLFHAGSRNL
jgi:serine-type D-Ala-D-Ala carboxypeptidase/endopeptidase (penicillin-binding protein 4)